MRKTYEFAGFCLCIRNLSYIMIHTVKQKFIDNRLEESYGKDFPI